MRASLCANDVGKNLREQKKKEKRRGFDRERNSDSPSRVTKYRKDEEKKKAKRGGEGEKRRRDGTAKKRDGENREKKGERAEAKN